MRHIYRWPTRPNHFLGAHGRATRAMRPILLCSLRQAYLKIRQHFIEHHKAYIHDDFIFSM